MQKDSMALRRHVSTTPVVERVLLAFSGGLDTSVAIRWLQEKYGCDVVTVTFDVGQAGELAGAVERAKAIGAVETHMVDAVDEFAREYIFPAIRANALYENAYPLSTALARPLIAKKMVEFAAKSGCSAVAHGCTGKGNDQVRFDVAFATLAPHLRVLAPTREWGMTREEEVAYAKAHSIPLKMKKGIYSVDENLWGRAIEGGGLEVTKVEPPEEVYEWTRSPAAAPAEPRYLTIAFEQGVPVALDGKTAGPVELIRALNAVAGENGVGRIDHIEDRLVGIKSREVYECPAATVLIAAHRALEKLTLTRDVLQFKATVEQRFTELVYNGLWFSPLMDAVQAFIEKTQEKVSGTVKMKLWKGSASVVGLDSPFSLYDAGLSTYSGGDTFDHSAAKGFIYVWGLQSRCAAQVGRGGVRGGNGKKRPAATIPKGS